MVHQQRHMPSGKNKIRTRPQISKHHLISQREIWARRFSGNKPSLVALYENHAILFIEMLKENKKY